MAVAAQRTRARVASTRRPPSQLELGLLPVEELAHFAAREGKRQRPIYGAHKWFARRAGAAFRALLVGTTVGPDDHFWDAYYDADLTGRVVLDAFVGGGTSVVEAQRLGATAIGVDVDPVACAVTTFETEAAAQPDLTEPLQSIKAAVATKLAPYHVTTGPDGAERVVVHHFWVQLVECGGCGHEIEAHPHYRLAFEADGRRQWSFCPDCHAIVELDRKRMQVRCGCGRRYGIDEGVVVYGRVTCPTCSNREALIEIARRAGRPRWRLFALETIASDPPRSPVPMSERLFQTASDADRARFAAAAEALVERERAGGHWIPSDTIPSARLDNRLHDYGYLRFRELFNERQLLHLSLLAESIDALDGPEREGLAIAFSDHLTTNCMLTCYAFGWRRLVPLFAVRGYRHVPRPVEINPWLDGTGRGTFPNAVRQLERAAAFARAPAEPERDGGFRAVAPRSAPKPRIVNRDSRKLVGIADDSVDVILTDPPYFDNIAYGELSEFFRPWLARLGLLETTARRRNLAAVARDEDEADEFVHRLGQAFGEMARVLKADGLITLTYRHVSAVGWDAFARAAATANLRCVQLFPLLAESTNGLHTHAGSGIWDAVYVLRPGGTPSATLTAKQVESARAHAALWAERLASGVPHPFAAADRTNFARAALVAASLGLFARGRGSAFTLADALAAEGDGR